jgi:hypothetical protein
MRTKIFFLILLPKPSQATLPSVKGVAKNVLIIIKIGEFRANLGFLNTKSVYRIA